MRPLPLLALAALLPACTASLSTDGFLRQALAPDAPPAAASAPPPDEAAERRRRQERAAADEKERQAVERDEAMWRQADAKDCEAPTRKGSCVGVQRYLDNLRAPGAHEAEARALLEAAPAKVAVHEEAEAWRKADVERCRAESTMCIGLEMYVKRYPDSPHRAEAEEALKSNAANRARAAAANGGGEADDGDGGSLGRRHGGGRRGGKKRR